MTDPARLNEIVNALQTRGANLPCPRCGNRNFEYLGEAVIPINDDPTVFAVGGPAVPVALVACSRCGHVEQHALGVLGLMRTPKNG